MLLHLMLMLGSTKTDCLLYEKSYKQNAIIPLGSDCIEMVVVLLREVIILYAKLTVV